MFRQSVRAAWRKLAVGLVAASMLVAPIAAPAAALATGIEDIPVTFLPVGDEDYNDQFVVTVGGSSTSSASSDYDYADGSAGFFRYIGADAAAAVLEKAPFGSAAGKYYQEAVDNIESTRSPFNLDAMMTSLEIVEDCNALRQRESDCDDLLIDPYLMALSQLCTAWASHVYSDSAVDSDSHAASDDLGISGENLAWNSVDVDYAFNQWYDQEKSLYYSSMCDGIRNRIAQLMAKKTDTVVYGQSVQTYGDFNNSVYVASAEYPDQFGRVGHYLNVINPRYSFTGAGFAAPNAGSLGTSTYEQSFEFHSSGSKTYTVSEFKRLLSEYLDMVGKGSSSQLKPQTITCQSTFNKRVGDPGFWLEPKTTGPATFRFSSSNDAVASVNPNGYVTVNGAGTATITITAVETDEYASATKDVKVVVSDAVMKRYVNLPTNVQHGTVSISQNPVPVGETVTVTLTPEDGYKVGSFSAVDAYDRFVSYSESGNTRTFTRPDADVTLSVEFIDISTQRRGVGFYRGTPEHGTVVVVGGEFHTVGSQVFIVAMPDEGYKLETISVMDCLTSEYPALSGSGDTWSFTLPDADVAIFATFVPDEGEEHGISASVTGGKGTVATSDASARAGDVITVSFTPDEGYEVSSIRVTDASGNAVATVGSGNSRSFIMPDSDVTVTVLFAQMEQTGGIFSDVHDGDWYYDAVKWVSSEGIMNGQGDGTNFAPTKTLQRSEMAQLLWNMYGNPASSAADAGRFTDCDVNAWYAEAVAWAYSTGAITGYDEHTFGPLDTVTREQFATIIWRLEGEPTVSSGLSEYPDAAKVSSFATEAMKWAVSEGIITGDGGMLKPSGSLTRAEAAQMIMRWQR